MKERTFAFLTTDSFRIEVKATSTRQAYFKAKKIAESKGHKITKTYTTYGRDGVDTGWRGMR